MTRAIRCGVLLILAAVGVSGCSTSLQSTTDDGAISRQSAFVPYGDDALVAKADQIVFHFDGNINDPDDIAAVPVAAALIKAANLQNKTTFIINNNLMEGYTVKKYNGHLADKMRASGAFAKSLGIAVYDHMTESDRAIAAMVNILDSGDTIVSFEGGPMEAVYQALIMTGVENRPNITLVSHSSWNEMREKVTRPDKKGQRARTWKDLKSDFSDVNLLEIDDQNKGNNNDQGFNNMNWTVLLDATDHPVLKAMQAVMIPAGETKKNDPSDAGMLYYALTGDQAGTAHKAMQYLTESPHLSFVAGNGS